MPFVVQVNKYRTDIEFAWTSVSKMCAVFDREENIWPDQCSRAIEALHAIRLPLQNFVTHLTNHPYLSIAGTGISSRNSLVIALRHADRLVGELILLIDAFKDICKNPSSKKITQQLGIQKKLASLEQECINILHGTDELHFAPIALV
jgi:hypothetical protein